MNGAETIRVQPAGGAYDIRIGTELVGDPDLWRSLPTGGRALVVTNAVVEPLYGEAVLAALRGAGCEATLCVLEDGESSKSWPSVEAIVGALLAARADRQSTVVALGGGVVGDVAGFAASLFMRGIGVIQVPTTLLAQVDSSVGGKTAINHAAGKNLIGTFHQPVAVVADLDTLGTLPERELRAGMAEAIKTAAVADARFFAWLESSIEAVMAREPEALRHVVRRCCEIKAEVVGADEREAGRRAILNFGHTFGHAIEAAGGYADHLHGEAVAGGMSLAAALSTQLGFLPAEQAARVDELMRRAGLRTDVPAMPADRWLEWMRHDKKALGGRIRFVLLEAIGRATLRAVDDDGVHELFRRRATAL